MYTDMQSSMDFHYLKPNVYKLPPFGMSITKFYHLKARHITTSLCLINQRTMESCVD